MHIRRARLYDALPLSLLIMVSYFYLLGFTPQDVVKPIIMALFIQAPGFYFTKIMGNSYSLQLDEFIVSNIIFSCLTILFSYVFLSTIIGQVTGLILWWTLTLIAIGSAIIFYIHTKMKDEPPRIDINSVAALLLSYIPSIIIVSMALPQEYWRGSDAWETHTIVRSLVSNSMSPGELISYWESFVYLYNFGYYYLLAAFSLATGFSVDSILRFGGFFQSAFLALLTYISVKKMIGLIWGVFASWIIFLNPSMVLRWVTPIRENFSILLLLFVIYYIQLVDGSKDRSRLINILVYTSILMASVMIHTLTPLFILAVYLSETLNMYLKGRRADAFEYAASTVTAVTLLALFFPYTADPFSSFLRNNPATLTLITLGSFTLVLGLLLLKRLDLLVIMRMWKLRIALISFIVLIVTLAILRPPSFEIGYIYGYIEEDNFFIPFLVLSLIGAFSFVKARVPLAIGIVVLMISASLVASYIGIQVPLSRLTIYLAWVMSYVTAHFLSTLYSPVRTETASGLVGSLKKCGELCEANKVLLIIIFVFTAMAVNEIEGQRRFIPTFSSYEIESTRVFIDSLGEGDLVYAQSQAEIMLYYLGIPREKMVHDASKSQELGSIFEVNSPYFVSELVQETYPEAKKLHIVLHGYEQLVYSSMPIDTLFQFYTENRRYGNTFVYSLGIPFTLEGLGPKNIKFVEALNDEPVIEDGGPNAWEHSIWSVSNCAFESGVAQSFKIYYVGVDPQGVSHLGLAYSADGVYWSKYDEPLYTGSYRQLFLVQDEKRYMFCQRVSDLSIVRIESADGINWGNESLLIAPIAGETIRMQESPIVWKENGAWHMLYWELSSGPDTYRNGMIYANSSDGLHWTPHGDLLNWALYDSTYRNLEYYKIHPMNIFRTDDGYTVLARCLLGDSGYAQGWIPCTIYLEDSLFRSSAVFNSLFFTGLKGPIKIDTVHQLYNPIMGRTQFFFIDYDDYSSQGSTNGVMVGIISDHLSVS